MYYTIVKEGLLEHIIVAEKEDHRYKKFSEKAKIENSKFTVDEQG